MNSDERQVMVTQWIHGRLCVVRLEVPAVVSDDEPETPYFTPQTHDFLVELRRLADEGDVDRLREHGPVYVLHTPASQQRKAG